MALEIKTIKGEIEIVSGLHIGGNKDTLEIGGIDNPVIKDPITGYPYIPGSSLKGKLRSLLEWYIGRPFEILQAKQKENKKRMERGERNFLDESVGPCNCGQCIVCRLFGSTNENAKHPTSIVVRDCFITDETQKRISEEHLNYLEEKVENSIDRIKGKATNPRHTERVAPKVKFSFEINYKIFDKKEKEEFKNAIATSLALLEKDYLGGNGSRGYGRIKFLNVRDENGEEFKIEIKELNKENS